ncbi:MAG: hypothetical protein LBG80_10410 [Bacteroidales bacterium]|jgi:hypothetical protein|nr:hypothetical protein [Bacteroidales bacterium]
MKTRCLILIGLFFVNGLYSQDIISQLKKFYEEADMDCYLDKAQKNIIEDYIVQCQWWGIDTIIKPLPQIDLNKDNTVPMLTIQFVDTETFNYSDDIYNYITIDSSRVFMFAYIDKKMNVIAFVNFFDGIYAYFDMSDNKSPFKTKKQRKLKKVIKHINELQPEQILYCSALSGFHDDNGFMYIKDGKIYVYRVVEGDIFELNEYIRKFFDLERISRLNYTFIPSIYIKEESTRRTGNTPENEKMLCPPKSRNISN